MKKIMNEPSSYVDEFLDGVIAAHPRHLKRVPGESRAIMHKEVPIEGKVGIVTGGGSGHLPLFLGYVGPGMVDAAAVGNVFSSPSAEQILAATRAADSGSGVIYLFGNYAGDVMNFEIAAEAAADMGIETAACVVTDDVASAPAESSHLRRGVAGLFFVYRLAGAKAATGASLGEVRETAELAVSSTRSLGVALSPCTVPEVGRPTFTIGEDEMEIGMGIHGERGVETSPLARADDIAANMIVRITEDIRLQDHEEVAVLVNGLGATSMEELYILLRSTLRELEKRNARIVRSYVGEYATSMEMKGASVSLLRMNTEFMSLLEKPYYSPFLLQEPR